VREAAKIVSIATAAAIAYGVVHDQVTARLSIEYFTVAHPPLVATASPTWVGAAWGVVATWWLGAALGALLACAARAGGRPARSARSLLRPVALVVVAALVSALALGGAGWLGARSGTLALREPFASRVPTERHARFFAAWGATGGSYAAGLVGGLVLCAGVWRARGRDVPP
jgi:hypothetical protein